MIPEDWEVKKLVVIADIKTGPFGSALPEKDYVEDGTPIITVEHLGELGVLHKNIPMVSDSDKKRLNAYILQTGDIVFSRVGSVDRSSLVSDIENNWLFSSRLLRVRVNNQKASSVYLNYHFHQESTKQIIRSVAVGQTMASLNTEILKNIEIILPPTIKEQKAIAQSLSDVDALIAECDRIITKKRNIKQSTMQQLLTGKKRLPGFSGEWKVEELGNISLLERGKFSARPRNDPKFFGGDISFIQTGDVTKSNGLITTYNQSLNYQGLRVSKLFPSNTLFFTIAANIGGIGIASFETACPDSLIAITPQTKVDEKWLFHALKSQKNHLRVWRHKMLN